MKKRFVKNKKGFTLLEVVVTMVMVSLIGIAIAGGVAASARVYKESVSTSESQLLASTLLKAVENELRYADSIIGSGTDVTFYSNKYGGSCRFETFYKKPGQGEPTPEEKARFGQITLGGYPLIGSGAYSNGTNQRKSAGVVVSWNSTNQVFEVELSIYLGVHNVKEESPSVLEASLLKKETMTITPLKYI